MQVVCAPNARGVNVNGSISIVWVKQPSYTVTIFIPVLLAFAAVNGETGSLSPATLFPETPLRLFRTDFLANHGNDSGKPVPRHGIRAFLAGFVASGDRRLRLVASTGRCTAKQRGQ